MRSPVRTRYVALPMSAALLLLSGCASSGSGNQPNTTSHTTNATPLRLIQAAYETTTSAKTARLTMTTDMTGLSSDPGPHSVTASIAEDFKNNIFDESMPLQGETFEVRLIGHDLYLKIPQGDSTGTDPTNPGPSSTKAWQHVSLPKQIRHNALALFSVLRGSITDPAQYVQLLTKASSNVTRVGTDVIRGQQSVHYRLTLDSAKIAQLEEQMGRCPLSAGAKSALPVDVWLDGDGRVTRLKTSQRFPEHSSEASSGSPSGIPQALPSTQPPLITTTVELYDYGAALHVTPPPADQVQDVAKDYPADKLFSAHACVATR